MDDVHEGRELPAALEAAQRVRPAAALRPRRGSALRRDHVGAHAGLPFGDQLEHPAGAGRGSTARPRPRPRPPDLQGEGDLKEPREELSVAFGAGRRPPLRGVHDVAAARLQPRQLLPAAFHLPGTFLMTYCITVSLLSSL